MIRELAPRERTATFIAVAFEPLALALALGGDLARAATLEGYADAALRAQRRNAEVPAGTSTFSHRSTPLL